MQSVDEGPRNALIAPEKGQEEFDDVISDHAQYGRIQFWDERYLKDQEPFEWLKLVYSI